MDCAAKLVLLDQSIQATVVATQFNEGTVAFDAISDREQRTTVHKVCPAFYSLYETSFSETQVTGSSAYL